MLYNDRKFFVEYNSQELGQCCYQQRDYQTNFDGTCFFRFMPSSDLDSFDAVAALHKHFDVEAYVEGKI
jgi:hypothetical protein